MKILFFDTETTGLPKDWKAPVSRTSDWPRLVQIAWFVTDNSGNVLKEREYIICPSDFTIPTDASKIHGITTELAKRKGLSLDVVLEELNSHISDADIIVAHNMNFDEKIIGAEFYRKNINSTLFDKKRICTMEQATKYCAIPSDYGFKWPTLSELYLKLFAETFNEAHNALNDIRATIKCFWKLVEKGIITIPEKKSPKKIMSPDIFTIEQINLPIAKKNSPELIQENIEYVDLWSTLSTLWKVQINSQMKEINLQELPLKGLLTNDDAKSLKDFFQIAKSFGTGSHIFDLEPIVNFKNLQSLKIGPYIDKKIYFPSHRGTHPLEDEYHERVSSANLSENIKLFVPLQHLTILKSLDCQNWPITDISPLQNLQSLEYLNISGTDIHSISPLRSHKHLKYLNLGGCSYINDFSPLENLSNIEHLDISNTDVASISTLKNHIHLKYLDLCGCSNINDLSPLENLSIIEHLDISYTNVASISTLKNHIHLKYLNFSNTPINDLSPLENLLSLKHLIFNVTPIKDIEQILNLPNLETINCDAVNIPFYQINKLKSLYPKSIIKPVQTIIVNKNKKQGSGCLSLITILLLLIILIKYMS